MTIIAAIVLLLLGIFEPFGILTRDLTFGDALMTIGAIILIEEIR